MHRSTPDYANRIFSWTSLYSTSAWVRCAACVGRGTFGKGLVQSVRSLSDGSGLTVTVAKYLTPSGKDINKNGIEPDIRADLLLNEKNKLTNADLGTLKDSQYVVAENILLKKFKIESSKNSYNPLKSNLGYALKN